MVDIERVKGERIDRILGLILLALDADGEVVIGEGKASPDGPYEYSIRVAVAEPVKYAYWRNNGADHAHSDRLATVNTLQCQDMARAGFGWWTCALPRGHNSRHLGGDGHHGTVYAAWPGTHYPTADEL